MKAYFNPNGQLVVVSETVDESILLRILKPSKLVSEFDDGGVVEFKFQGKSVDVIQRISKDIPD